MHELDSPNRHATPLMRASRLPPPPVSRHPGPLSAGGHPSSRARRCLLLPPVGCGPDTIERQVTNAVRIVPGFTQGEVRELAQAAARTVALVQARETLRLGLQIDIRIDGRTVEVAIGPRDSAQPSSHVVLYRQLAAGGDESAA